MTKSRIRAGRAQPVTRRGKIERVATTRGFTSGLEMLKTEGQGKTVEELAALYNVHARNLFAYLTTRGLRFKRRLLIEGIEEDTGA